MLLVAVLRGGISSRAIHIHDTIANISSLLCNWFAMRFPTLALALAISHVNSQTFDGPDPAHPWIAAGPDDCM